MKKILLSITAVTMLTMSALPAHAMYWQCTRYSSNVQTCDQNGNCQRLEFEECSWYEQIYWDAVRWWNSDWDWR